MRSSICGVTAEEFPFQRKEQQDSDGQTWLYHIHVQVSYRPHRRLDRWEWYLSHLRRALWGKGTFSWPSAIVPHLFWARVSSTADGYLPTITFQQRYGQPITWTGRSLATALQTCIRKAANPAWSGPSSRMNHITAIQYFSFLNKAPQCLPRMQASFLLIDTCYR